MHDVSRRMVLAGVAAMTGASRAGAGEAERLAWEFSFPSIDEGTLALGAFRGRVLLVANTASFCGYNYQYEGLEKLNRDLAARGLTVVGVPSQDFNQESNSNAAVKTFCEATFGVEFPMAGLSHVVGPGAAPFYAWVHDTARWEPKWNFNKVLIGRDGRIKGTFGSSDEPGGARLDAAIQAELGRPPAA